MVYIFFSFLVPCFFSVAKYCHQGDNNGIIHLAQADDGVDLNTNLHTQYIAIISMMFSIHIYK